MEPEPQQELSEDQVVHLLHAVAARSAATIGGLHGMEEAGDDTFERAEAWARRRGIVLMQRTYTSTEVRRLGPGFSFEMPGMEVPDSDRGRGNHRGSAR